MKHDEFLQVLRNTFHFATCDAVLRGCKIVDISKPLQWRRLSKKVCSPLGPPRRGRVFDSLSRYSGRAYSDRGCKV